MRLAVLLHAKTRLSTTKKWIVYNFHLSRAITNLVRRARIRPEADGASMDYVAKINTAQ